jgi:hypothetical protein
VKKVIGILLERPTKTLPTNDKKMFVAEKALSVYFQLIIHAICVVGKTGIAPERKVDSKRAW